MDRCTRCKKEKEDANFVTCRHCRNEKNKQAKTYYKKWHDGSRVGEKERFLLRNKNARLKRKYGIILADYNLMFENQKGRCGICSLPFRENNKKGWGGKSEACVDHNHITGKVRGILCRGCNLALSMIEDENFLFNANQYLKQVGDVEDKELLR